MIYFFTLYEWNVNSTLFKIKYKDEVLFEVAYGWRALVCKWAIFVMSDIYNMYKNIICIKKISAITFGTPYLIG